jgi:hypothetical protein
MKARFKNTMKERELEERDVEVEEEEVKTEGVVVEDVDREEVIEVVEVVPLMEQNQKENLREEPNIEMMAEMKEEMIRDLEVKEDRILVEEMAIRMLIVKEATAIKDQEVKDIHKERNHMVITKETENKMKEVTIADLEVAKEITTTTLKEIDQEEAELKADTTMKVELKEETEILDHKLLMTNQTEVYQEAELPEAISLTEEEP